MLHGEGTGGPHAEDEDPERLVYFARVKAAIRRRLCDDPEFADELDAIAYQAQCRGHRAPEHYLLCEWHASDKSCNAPNLDTGSNDQTAFDEFADLAGELKQGLVNDVNFVKRVSRKAGGRRERR